MTRQARPLTSTIGGPERVTNALALLALVAIGVVWPPLEPTDTRHITAAARRESRRDVAAPSRSCLPEGLGRERAAQPMPATLGPPRA